MIRLLRDHLLRTWHIVFIAGAGIFGFQAVVVLIFENITAHGDPQAFGRNLPQGIQSFFGIDRLPISTLSGFLAVAYQHPFLIAALLAVPIAIVSLLLAGEVEKKTISLLLARPISRISIVGSCSVVCALYCGVLVACALGGNYLGAKWVQLENPPSPGVLFNVALNLYMLALAVSGVAIVFSAWASDRSDAVGWTVTIVLMMYVWNFLAQTWPAVKPYGVYSLFYYYAPARIFMGGASLFWDYQFLAVVAAIGCLVACLIYKFRDFSA